MSVLLEQGAVQMLVFFFFLLFTFFCCLVFFFSFKKKNASGPKSILLIRVGMKTGAAPQAAGLRQKACCASLGLFTYFTY